ncbi:protoporphyrinogen/coproporphyrinogen oxidase [Nocardia amamiensis]|uniref:protoporphyrinogen/coproporphyrinogen oxidase n=1 Tax=Nocardia amamiensis TaxID=404578 RepID=UPI00082FE9E3|nr:FAD-dependent oxidoreductase [Nocardia amamiensis]
MVMKVAVVGSGISGISAAVKLHLAGLSVELIEKDDVLGGRLGVSKLGGHDVMLGGKNIGRRYPVLRTMLDDLGANGYEQFGINTSRVKEGVVLPIDSTRRLRTVTNLARLSGPRDFLTLARLAAQVRGDDSARLLGSEFARKLSVRYDDRPLSEHFGSELVNNVVRPVTVRMNGAEPAEVYLGNFGTNLAMLLDTYDQLTSGIQPVLSVIERLVDVRLSSTVHRIERADDASGDISVTMSTPQGTVETTRYNGVVLATPAHIAADILSANSADFELLRSVNYFPAAVAVVEYADDVFRPDIRAIAMDDGPCSNAGSYGINQRNVVRYTFSGRQARAIGSSGDEIASMVTDVESLLVTYLGIRKPARVDMVTRHWDAAYCAYGPRYGDFLDTVRARTAQVGPKLALAGDYMLGVSLENCCRSGRKAATAVLAQL